MNNKKKIISITFITTIFIIITGIIASHYSKSMAAALTSLSGLSYDGALSVSIGSTYGASAGVTDHATYTAGPSNQSCFHNDSLDSGATSNDNAHKVVAKILIDADGTMHYTTASGSADLTGYKTGGKALAYYGYKRCSPNTTTTNAYYTDSDVLIHLYKNAGLDSVQNTSNTGTSTNTDYNDAQTYASGSEEKYVGLVIVLAGHDGVQDKILVFGKEDDKPKLTHDKYIKKVNSTDASPARNGQTDTWKQNNAPEVEKEDTVTYKIPIKNESTSKDAESITFEDQFDTTCFDAIDSGYCTISGGGSSFSSGPSVDASGKITATIAKINKNETATITVTLKVKDSDDIAENTKYKNGAKVGDNDWVYDYVTVYVPKVKIDKYITKVETIGGDDDGDGTIIPSSRAAVADSDWNGGNNSTKESNPVKVACPTVKVYYTIKVKNEGTKKVKGTLKDTFDTAFLSNLQGDIPSGEFEIAKGETKTFKITLDGKEGAADGKYKNKAKFTPTKGKAVSSKDWVQLGEIKPPTINKYITSITNGNHSGDRSTMSEEEKANSPDDAGKNDSDKTITYNIIIKNPNKFAIEGTFTDEIDSEVTIDSIKNGSTTITSGSKVEIAANSSVTIVVTATFAEGGEAGIYENMAKYVYDTMEVESRDYFEISEELEADVELHKYISSVTDGNLIGDDRSGWSVEDKNNSPVEVKKGSEVTYTITLENNIHYQNTSGSCHGDRCDGTNDEGADNHLDKHDLSYLKCEDVWVSGLEFVSISGTNNVSYDAGSNQIVWKDVEEGDTVEAQLKLKVTASDMTLANLENRAGGTNKIYYEYELYRCTPYHGNYYSVPCATHGSHTRCDHTNCGLRHNHSTKSGTLTAEDRDYVRLLDPIVEGKVWDDQNKDGLSTGESLSTIIREDYKHVVVKLYKLSDNSLIATKTVDADGKYSFGRVRKGTVKTGGKDSTTDTWFEVAENQWFNYNSASLVEYYITFEYNGERYQATTPSGEDQFRETNPNYQIDSNAEEQDRESFNQSLETISYNRAFANTNGNGNGKPLNYEVSGGGESGLQVSTLTWDGNSIEDTTSTDWSNNYTSTAGANRSVTMIAKTYKFYFPDGEVDYLKHIDFGIYQRDDDIDLSTEKDVISAEVTVNSHPTTYGYEGLGTDPYIANSNNVLSEPYSLKIYREDYEFRTAKYDSEVQAILNANNPYKDFGRDNDLHIILTYKIKITNNSANKNAIVREIIDYSSKTMTLLDGTVTLDGTALTTATSSTYKNSTYSGSLYNQTFINDATLNGKTLGPGESLEIYMKYRVLKDDNGYILIEDATAGTEDSKMNIAEIGAYSIYDGDKPAGLIDKNSNPGNIEFDGEGKAISDKFEDDTFETGIVVLLRDTPPPPPPPRSERHDYRNISGIVFEELNPTTNVDGQLVGDGIMNNSDIPAANVIVKLYEVVQRKNTDGSVAEELYVDTGLWYRTGADGRYYFGEMTEEFDTNNKPVNVTSDSESKDDCYRLHAGLYVVRFIYGDEADKLETTDGNTIKYSGQDYQSVKYTDVGDSTKEDEIVKATAFAEKSGNTTPFDTSDNPTLGTTIYSVAKDNEIRRLEVNEYSTTTTYPMDTVLKANAGSEEAKLLAQHTAMFADTKTFDMDIEYYDNYTKKVERTIDGKVKIIGHFYYSVRDINFGLIERPKTKLQLMNDITEVRAITSDGTTLIDALFNIKYEKVLDSNGRLKEIKHTAEVDTVNSKGLEQVQILNRNGNNQGFRYANIDTDLLQGMTITIKFRIAVANIGDVDHLSSWLEAEMKKSSTDLNVKNYNSTESTSIKYNANDSKVTDVINGQEREYTYSHSYLYNLLYNGDTDKSITSLRQATTGDHVYNSAVLTGSEAVRKIYSYTNIKNKVQSDYSTGYYLGNIYYNATESGNEARVETRADQFIDYVDNDLIFKPEENLNSDGQIEYLTYTTEEIAKRGLLKDITDSVIKITDGEKDYYNADVQNTNNNLAFNIEDASVNGDFYKFLTPIEPTGGDIPLYTMDLQASRTLTSEVDINGIVIDNIAEIVKATNTAGRKVYVKAEGTNTGYLGNTTKKPIESVNDLTLPADQRETFVEISKREIDTDFTEYVTFSPPTGLNAQQSLAKTIADKTGDVLLILIPVVIIIAGMSYVTVQVVKRKKFYK